MSQEKLLGIIKDLAQRLATAATESTATFSNSRVLAASMPNIKGVSKSMTDSVSSYHERIIRTRVLANELLRNMREEREAKGKRQKQIENAEPMMSRTREAPRITETKRDQPLFEEVMRDTYESGYSVANQTLKGEEEKDVSVELEKPTDIALPSKPTSSTKDVISATGALLKDILPVKKKETEPAPLPAPVIPKASIDSRTRALVQALRNARSTASYQTRIDDLCHHLLKFTDAKYEAVRCGAIALLLEVVLQGVPALRPHAYMGLALLGYTFPPEAPGPRILAIDGGGTRGLVALEVLRELERLTGKPPYELFDYFIGVSAGSVVITMLAAYRLTAEEAMEYYKRTCTKLFTRDSIAGARRLLMSHGYYDSALWESELKKQMGEKHLIEVSRESPSKRMALVSTKIDEPDCNAFLFRNYTLPTGSQSHYEGSCKYRIWEGARASSAAPGYFSEFRLDGSVHQDGGILNNNPTAVGIHECRLLWPKERLWSVVSMGTGRFRRSQEVHNRDIAKAVGLTSWKSKLASIIASATDTEGVHVTLQDLLPPSTYFRVQPVLSEDLGLDVDDPKKMDVLIKDSRKFVRDNPVLMRHIAEKLTMPRPAIKKANDWMTLQKDSTDFARLNIV